MDSDFFALAWLSLYNNGKTRPYEKRTTGIRNFRLDDFLASESLYVPPLDEQRRIALILRTIQTAKVKDEEVAVALRSMKKSLQQQFFREAELHWTMVPIAEVGKVITGRTPSTRRPEYYGGTYPFIGPGDLDGRGTIVHAAKTLSDQGLGQAKELPLGTVLTVCIGATIGKVARTGCKRSATNQQINALVPDDSVIDPLYAHRALEYFAKSLPPLASTAAIPIVNKSNFERLHIPLPSLEDQTLIARTLESVDSYSEAIASDISALDTIFASASARLFGDLV